MKNIVLIGIMGCGKTTILSLLAKPKQILELPTSTNKIIIRPPLD